MTKEEVMMQEEQDINEEQQVKQPKLRWLPLESNPDVSSNTTRIVAVCIYKGANKTIYFRS